MNKTILVGNLTRDPLVSVTSGGKQVARVDIAVNRRLRDGTQLADYYSAHFWEDRVKLTQSLRKGDRVLLEGRLTARAYMGRDGVAKAALEMSDPQMEYLSPRRTAPEQPQTEAPAALDAQTGYSVIEDDDLPF